MVRALVLVAHALVGWGVCGATMFVGPRFLSMSATLVVHAFVAPLAFAVLSWLYVRRYRDASPLGTAAALTSVVVGLDAFLVAPVFVGSYEMFESPLGTWIPFASILAASYLVARATGGRRTGDAPAGESR